MTSEWRMLFDLLWETALRVQGPFEIAEVVPEAARRLGQNERAADRELRLLLGELARMPEGRQYFTVEGNAVVTLPEVQTAPSRADAYPFEL